MYTLRLSVISSVFDGNASRIVNEDFNDIRSFLIVSNNSVHVDVHVNVDNYLNHNIYDHNFQSKPESNNNSFKPGDPIFSLYFNVLSHVFETQL